MFWNYFIKRFSVQTTINHFHFNIIGITHQNMISLYFAFAKNQSLTCRDWDNVMFINIFVNTFIERQIWYSFIKTAVIYQLEWNAIDCFSKIYRSTYWSPFSASKFNNRNIKIFNLKYFCQMICRQRSNVWLGYIRASTPWNTNHIIHWWRFSKELIQFIQCITLICRQSNFKRFVILIFWNIIKNTPI